MTKHRWTSDSDKIHDDLLAIAQAWPDLEERLSLPMSGHQIERIKSTSTPGIIINGQVSSVIQETTENLRWLWDLIMPSHRCRFGMEPKAPNYCRALALRADSLLEHKKLIRRMRHQVENTAYPDGLRTYHYPNFPCQHSNSEVIREPNGMIRISTYECSGHWTAKPIPGAGLPDMICSRSREHVVPARKWLRQVIGHCDGRTIQSSLIDELKLIGA